MSDDVLIRKHRAANRLDLNVFPIPVVCGRFSLPYVQVCYTYDKKKDKCHGCHIDITFDNKRFHCYRSEILGLYCPCLEKFTVLEIVSMAYMNMTFDIKGLN